MNKMLEKLILALVETQSISANVANQLLKELGSPYPGYETDKQVIYVLLLNSGEATAAALKHEAGIDEGTLSRLVKSRFLNKTADNKYKLNQ